MFGRVKDESDKLGQATGGVSEEDVKMLETFQTLGI